MDETSLYEKLSALEQHHMRLSQVLQEAKIQLERLTQENNDLKLENQHLRARLDEWAHKSVTQQAVADGSMSSLACRNLEQLHESGFHVCRYYYGSRLVEECLFCAEILSQK